MSGGDVVFCIFTASAIASYFAIAIHFFRKRERGEHE